MEIEERLKEAFKPVLEGRCILMAVLFGSVASHRYRADSDIDIAVETGKVFDFREHGELLSGLQEAAVKAGIEKEIDIAYLDRADPLFLKKIFESAVLIAGQPGRLSIWRLRAFRAYLDFLPYLQMEAVTARRIADRLSG